MKTKYTTLFVDLDDTIWDTQANNKEALREIYDTRGWNTYFDSFKQFFDRYLPININLWSLYGQGKITKDELIVERLVRPLQSAMPIDRRLALDINEELLNRISVKTKLVDGAEEVLSYLTKSYQLVILSNGFTEVQFRKLRNSRIEHYFRHIILSDQVGVNKPHPEIFSIALKQAQAKPGETLMIGDSWDSDITGAHNRGIDQVWFNPEKKASAGFQPTYTIEKLKELKSIL